MINQEQADFLAARKNGIGGSDIAAIMGLSQFKTAMDVYQAKISPNVEQQTAEHLYWGHALEAPICNRFSEETGYPIFRQPEIRQHPQHEWAIANADALILDKETDEPIGILEIKTSSAFKSKAWNVDGDAESIPVEYFAQVQWYLEIFDLEMAYLAVLIGGNQYRHYPIKRDREIAANLIKQGRIFWQNHVLAQVPPPPTNAAEVAQYFPQDNGETAQADTETLIAYNALILAKQELAEKQSQVTELENQLKIKIGQAQQMNDGERKLFTWKTQTSRRFDGKAFQAAHPELYKQFLSQTQTRVLRVAG